MIILLGKKKWLQYHGWYASNKGFKLPHANAHDDIYLDLIVWNHTILGISEVSQEFAVKLQKFMNKHHKEQEKALATMFK